MARNVTTYEYGVGPIYIHLKKHFCPDCNVRLDTAYTTETLSGKESLKQGYGVRYKGNGISVTFGETDVRTLYFYCPKCYRRIYPKEMKRIETLQKQAEQK